MNLLVLCCFIFGGSLVLAGKDMPPEIMAVMEKGVVVCQPKYGVSDEDLAKIMDHQFPKSEEGICFMGCMMKQIGILQADNQLNSPVVMEMGKPLQAEHPKMWAALPTMVEYCSTLMNPGMDECEATKKLVMCVSTKGKELGITKFPFFEQ